MSLLEMSLAGGAIILAAIVIRALGKDRLPLGAFMALWGLAVLRLTVPVRLPFRFSLFTLVRRLVPHTAAGPGPIPAAITAPGQAASQAVDIIQNTTLPGRGTPFPATTVIWLAGVVICLAVFTVSYIRARRTFRTAVPVTAGPAADWLAAHPLRRRVSLRRSDTVSAPLTYGVLRPVILLPAAMDGADEKTLSFVLTHEMAHIQRFHAVAKLIFAAVACLHWFNPLAWAMLVLAGRDMEICCDQAVARPLDGEARKDYARTLLDMEERRGGSFAASGFSRSAIEERIHSIMKIKKKSFWSTLLALVLVLGVGAVFATAAPEDVAVIGDADGPTTITVSEAAPGGFTGDVAASANGTVYVYTEDGEPIAMTREEFEALIDPVEVEWWTAEEYAQWLEQEKKDLQECLGQRAWTNTDGWFTWTQEKIDETIEMYEHTLEQIENGLLVSKTVDGSGDVMLAQGSGWDAHLMTGDEAALTERLEEIDEALAPYEPFDVTYAYDKKTDDVVLYWNGERVRGLYDSTAGVWITAHSGDGTWPEGTLELIAVYEGGELTGLRAATEEEQAQWDALRAASGASGSSSFSAPPEPEEEPVEEPVTDEPIAEEAGGTAAVPPNIVFFERADGAPVFYEQIEDGGRVKVAGGLHAAPGNLIAVGLETRTDATLTLSLHGDANGMGKSVDLRAGELQTVTFYPSQADEYDLYLTNNSESPVEFDLSWSLS